MCVCVCVYMVDIILTKLECFGANEMCMEMRAQSRSYLEDIQIF